MNLSEGWNTYGAEHQTTTVLVRKARGKATRNMKHSGLLSFSVFFSCISFFSLPLPATSSLTLGNKPIEILGFTFKNLCSPKRSLLILNLENSILIDSTLVGCYLYTQQSEYGMTSFRTGVTHGFILWQALHKAFAHICFTCKTIVWFSLHYS